MKIDTAEAKTGLAMGLSAGSLVFGCLFGFVLMALAFGAATALAIRAYEWAMLCLR